MALVAGLLLIVSPATGNPHDASDFFIFARAELGQFAEADCNSSNDKQADISGSNNEYHGRIHSHADLAVSGTGNRFTSALTYGTHDEDCQLQAEAQASPGGYLGGQPTEVDAPLPAGLDRYGWPGDLGSYLDPSPLAANPPHRLTFSSVGQALPGRTCDVGSLGGTDVLTVSRANHGQVVCNGTGKVQLAVSGAGAENPLVMSITILSHGTIEISGQNVRLSPAAHHVLAMTDQPSSTSDVSIKLSGSNLDVPDHAILFSPRSGQDISGSDGSDMCVQLVGQGRIKSAGSNSRFGPDLCRPPLRDVTLPAAPPRTFTVGHLFPGVSLTIETEGGIRPSGVTVEPARAHMAGRMAGSFAGPAFDIDVPSTAPPIRRATLTLPYHEQRLGGAAEEDLRIYTFDAASQFWVQVPGAQQVDPSSNTVTATVTHFSVYAVLKGRTAGDWAQIFGNTPVRCVGSGGTDVGIDIVFLVDSSGSMSTNDPQGRRVDGAKQFVDQMRFEQDRVAVVDFDSTARRVIDLTALETAAGRNAVKAALDQTNNASGGTDISAAVQQAIAVLSANGGGGRLRVAILLTDGQSLYNTALTTQAAEQAIEIHTVGLGAGVNTALLEGIANGTGGSYRFLLNPDELPALYEELAGDIIGGDTDTDSDTLSDCVERNGMFVPVTATLPFILTDPEFPSFITTNPTSADTDGDGVRDSGPLLADGTPSGELEARDLRTDPLLAFQFSFLIDAGLTTYYVMHSNPNVADTDGDGLNDGLERQNGTDPMIDDENELEIEGLDLPPFTLFQPARYEPKPVIERAFIHREGEDGSEGLQNTVFNDRPVRYGDDRTCFENCEAIHALAQARPDNELWDWCFFGSGSCADDASQAREIVEEARVKQRVFGSDGLLAQEFLRDQLELQCILFYADAQACGVAQTGNFSLREADQFVLILAASTVHLPDTVPRVPNPATLRRTAELLIAATAGIAIGLTAAEVAEMLDDCFRGPGLSQIGQQLAFWHPCETMPVYSPGADVGLAAVHRFEAIRDNPTFAVQRRATEAQIAARGPASVRRWYIGEPGCTETQRVAAVQTFGAVPPPECDEFPDWEMEKGGPPSPTNQFMMPALMYMHHSNNAAEGARLQAFWTSPNRCYEVSGPQRVKFLVVPRPFAPKTTFHCGLFRRR